MTEDERSLLEGCHRGDEQAWLVLYRAHAADIRLYLRGMLLPAEGIDDAVQRVFLGFLGSLDRFRGEASLRTWLHRIARNVALRDIRTRQRQAKHVRAYAETVDRGAHDPERQADARLQLEQVQAILTELEPSFREAWVLRELTHMSVAQVAAIVGVPEATVRTRHHRARRRILEMLEERAADQQASGPAWLKPVKPGEGS